MRNTPLLAWLPSPLWPEVVVSDKDPIYGLNRRKLHTYAKLNCLNYNWIPWNRNYILMLNWIVWITTEYLEIEIFLTMKLCIYILTASSLCHTNSTGLPTLFFQPSLSSVASGRSSRLHCVSATELLHIGSRWSSSLCSDRVRRTRGGHHL